MKSLALLLACLFAAVSATAATDIHHSPFITHHFNSVVLPAGETVTLELAEQIQSHKMTAGRLVKFRVLKNVVVNGRVVIATGAFATGRVKSIEKSTYSTPESITIEVVDVQAVDGQTVALSGMEQTFAAEWPNEPVVVPPGGMFAANTMNRMEIR